jgi:hypothetical protein
MSLLSWLVCFLRWCSTDDTVVQKAGFLVVHLRIIKKTAMNKPLLADLVWKVKNYKYLFSDVTDVFNNAL